MASAGTRLLPPMRRDGNFPFSMERCTVRSETDREDATCLGVNQRFVVGCGLSTLGEADAGSRHTRRMISRSAWASVSSAFTASVIIWMVVGFTVLVLLQMPASAQRPSPRWARPAWQHHESLWRSLSSRVITAQGYSIKRRSIGGSSSSRVLQGESQTLGKAPWCPRWGTDPAPWICLADQADPFESWDWSRRAV